MSLRNRKRKYYASLRGVYRIHKFFLCLSLHANFFNNKVLDIHFFFEKKFQLKCIWINSSYLSNRKTFLINAAALTTSWLSFSSMPCFTNFLINKVCLATRLHHSFLSFSPSSNEKKNLIPKKRYLLNNPQSLNSIYEPDRKNSRSKISSPEKKESRSTSRNAVTYIAVIRVDMYVRRRTSVRWEK